MALNSCEMWSNVIKIAFFSKNLQKSPSGWGLCPQTPVSDTFEYTSLLNTSSKLDFYTFQQLVFTFSLYQNPGKVPSGYGFRSSILRYFRPTKNYFFENFWWRHCVWFVVWAPPQSKILATPVAIPFPALSILTILLDKDLMKSFENINILIEVKLFCWKKFFFKKVFIWKKTVIWKKKIFLERKTFFCRKKLVFVKKF